MSLSPPFSYFYTLTDVLNDKIMLQRLQLVSVKPRNQRQFCLFQSSAFSGIFPESQWSLKSDELLYQSEHRGKIDGIQKLSNLKRD
jgi:hypothetical protein